MIQKLVIFSVLILSATCMVLHQTPLYLPTQYQERTPSYNFAYEVNDPHTGDFKRQQESRRADVVLGHYSLLQPDGVTRTVDYRADDHTGFNAVVNNIGRPNNVPSNRQEAADDGSGRQPDERSQAEQPRHSPNDQQVTPTPLTVTHTSVIHQFLHRLP
ncbi:unnamed protein product [Parnassius apollo]|uniref:(apollo) hypothetical protein n=1 Tax=Parnassius apollo TaxID=110799 RepID=A0A8S3X6G0_PARAO|nr:unnamed protein product [Parnassius apollo]